MLKKRIISLLLVLVMIVSAVPITASAASTMSAAPDTAVVGEEFEFVVTCSGIYGLEVGGIEVKYDTEALELVSVAESDCFDGSLYGACSPEAGRVKAGAVFATSSRFDSDTAVKIIFKALKSGSTDVSVSVWEWDGCDVPSDLVCSIDVSEKAIDIEPTASMFSFSDVAPEVGETFEMVVSCSGLRGLEAASFEISYDTSALECVSVDDNYVMENVTLYAAGNPEPGLITAGGFYSECCLVDSSDIVKITFKALKEGSTDLDVKVTEWAGCNAPADVTHTINIGTESVSGGQFTFSDVTPEVGETFEMVISCSGLRGLEAASFEISYDTSALECVSVDDSYVMENVDLYAAGNPEPGLITVGGIYTEGCQVDSSDIVRIAFKALKEGSTDLDVKETEWVGCKAPSDATHTINVRSSLDVYYYVVDNNYVVITGLSDGFSGSDLVIPAEIDGKPVTTIANYAFSSYNMLESVTIPEGVTTIGEGAFSWCNNLSSITIPDSVNYIGKSAIYNTAYYNNDENWDNNVLYVGNHLIKGYGISGDYVVKDDTKSIADAAFADATELTSVTMPDSVVGMGNEVFLYCSNLKSVELSNSITRIGDLAFFGCEKLESINIPDSVVAIGHRAFNYCNSISEITISKSVASISDSALAYSSFSSVNVASDNPNYKSIDGVLFNKDATRLIYYPSYRENKTYEIPSTVTEINSFIGEKDASSGAFSYSKYLESVVIPNSVIMIDNGVFSFSESLKSVTLPDELRYIGVESFYCCEALESITIPDMVTTIDFGAFYGCSSLKNVVIGNQVSSINGWAFKNCRALEYVALPQSLEAIYSEAFSNCESLTSISIPNKVTYVSSNLFDSCLNLQNVFIPASVSFIERGAFYNCYSLDTVNYGGDEDQWHKIAIGENNECLADAQIRYNCEFCYHDNTEHRDAVDSTCVVTGYGEGIFCTDCQQWITGHKAIPMHHVDSDNDDICDVCKQSSVYVISADESISLDVKAGIVEYIKFVPEVSGVYTFFSTGEDDAIGYFYDSDKNLICQREYGGVDNNFSLTQELTEGVAYYYSAAFAQADKSGALDVCLRQEKVSNINADETVEIDVVNDYLTYIEFTPKVSGIYTFTSISDVDTVGFLYDNLFEELANNDDGDEGSNFSITCELNAKTKYFLGVKYLNLGDATTISVKLTLDEAFVCAHENTTNHDATVTCTEAGFTAGVQCNDCEEWISGHEETKALGHKEEIIKGTLASCTEKGMSDGKKCSVCGEILVAQKEIAAPGHKEETIKATPASCTEKGFTEGKKCAACSEILVAQKEIAPLGHKEETIKGTPPTCTEKGMSDGKKCTVCGEITVAQKELPAKGHSFAQWTETKSATYTAVGEKVRKCSTCGVTETDTVAQLIAKNETVNPDTNVAIKYADGAFDGELTLEVNQVFDGTAVNILNLEKGNFKSVIFDINPMVNGEKVQPNGKVLVGIPLPEGFNKDNTFAYFVGEDGLEKLPCYYEDGRIWFEIDHFSSYALVDESEIKYVKGDINGDGKVSAIDARIALRISTKLEQEEKYPNAKLIADVNGDGKISAVDARLILRVATKLDKF